ncbi:MAG: DUF3592 domain-containing protein [Lachnospiraceae bacterium]|nr:DUF3592 domain-containing protein [Clostridia bacterium]MBQ8964873.1 DUF3592 domain-containing protein [Clostridia bacterium]MBQ9633180.1 DUF3592 domain-containing protein [Lachnospiraceae bacterium]
MVLKMLAFFAATSFVAWILLIMGFQTRRESRQRNETEHTRTTGSIVDYARGEHRYGKGGIDVYWKPVVEFIADGQKFHAEYPNRMDKDKYPVGTEVEILYDVSNPSRFHLEADPVFTDPGGGAIRMSLIWILISAVLTILLAVFVGGLRIDFQETWYRIGLFFHRIGRR